MPQFGLVGPSYTSLSPLADAETCINWYVEAMESGGARSKATLYPRPGLALFATLPEGPVRGELEINGRLFAVGGSKFCEVISGAAPIVLGTVANDGGMASLSSSQTQIFIVSGKLCYSYDLTSNVFSQVTTGVAGTAYALANFSFGGAIRNALPISAVGTTVTLEGNLTAPWVRAGDPITISNAVPSGYNGTYPIVSITDTLITFVGPSGLGSGTATGTVYNCVLIFPEDLEVVVVDGQDVTVSGSSAGFNLTYHTVTSAKVPAGVHFNWMVDSHMPIALVGLPPGTGGIATTVANTLLPVGGIMGGWCDGYFVRIMPDSKKWAISALVNATSWDDLDVSGVSVFPDNLVSLLVDHREVVLFGGSKTVIYYNSGNPDFPFDVAPGGTVEQGCAAQWSPVKLDNSVFWLGRDERGALVAWRAHGYTPVRVSNHAVEQEWQQYAVTSDTISYSYQWMGHSFWQIYFPTADKTWVYDTATGLWHRQAFWNGTAYTAHRSRCHAFAFGKHLVGDWGSGAIYEMVAGWSDDFGNQIRWERTPPAISNELKWLFHHNLVFDVEALPMLSGEASPVITLGGWAYNPNPPI